MLTLYGKIESLCKKFNTNITVMCKETNVSRASLSDLKMGRIKTLSTETLFKIASYFGTTVDTLISDQFNDGKDDKKNKPQSEESGLSDKAIEFIKMFEKMSESNREKLLELADLYLSAEKQKKENK